MPLEITPGVPVSGTKRNTSSTGDRSNRTRLSDSAAGIHVLGPDLYTAAVLAINTRAGLDGA
jgi:hypothetical protein